SPSWSLLVHHLLEARRGKSGSKINDEVPARLLPLHSANRLPAIARPQSSRVRWLSRDGETEEVRGGRVLDTLRTGQLREFREECGNGRVRRGREGVRAVHNRVPREEVVRDSGDLSLDLLFFLRGGGLQHARPLLSTVRLLRSLPITEACPLRDVSHQGLSQYKFRLTGLPNRQKMRPIQLLHLIGWPCTLLMNIFR
ncbi:hypothetical protein PMAYCL1PPCAC_21873, partial [Pristionchus mayeri]